MHKRNNNSGFTLIELLVVISIIGVLAAIVMVSLNSARQKANDARRLADIRSLSTALELYYNQYGSYPSTAPFGVATTITGLWDIKLSTPLSAYLTKAPSPAEGPFSGYFYMYGAASVGTHCIGYNETNYYITDPNEGYFIWALGPSGTFLHIGGKYTVVATCPS